MPNEISWYVARGGEQAGPFTDEQLRAYAELGDLKPDDQVWRPGFEAWQRAGDVRGLLHAPKIAGPPPLPRPAPPPLPAEIHSPTKESGGTKIRKVLTFLATAAFVAIAGMIGRNVANYAVPPPRSLEESLADAVRKANEKVPLMIDQDTRMDSVTLPSPNVLQNNYTLLNIDTPLPGEFARIEQKVREMIVNRACSTPSVARLLNRGIANVYAYHAADGSFFGSVTITKADCPRSG